MSLPPSVYIDSKGTYVVGDTGNFWSDIENSWGRYTDEGIWIKQAEQWGKPSLSDWLFTPTRRWGEPAPAPTPAPTISACPKGEQYLSMFGQITGCDTGYIKIPVAGNPFAANCVCKAGATGKEGTDATGMMWLYVVGAFILILLLRR